jgi:hypothetical protein
MQQATVISHEKFILMFVFSFCIDMTICITIHARLERWEFSTVYVYLLVKFHVDEIYKYALSVHH